MSIIEKAVDKLQTETVKTNEPPVTDIRVESPLPVSVAETKDNDIPKGQDAGGVEHKVEKNTSPAFNLPFNKLSEMGMITPDKPRSRIAEEYRGIKRPLLMNIDGKGAAQVENANLIMVTSALAGEGKTFSAINLAMSIAMEQDKTVLFVDADISKASAGALLGMPDNEGLIDVLLDNGKSIADVMLHTNIPNLRLLPAGHAHERATELLASESMQRVMKELSERYPDRVIVFDSPPLLQTTEAGVLANLMGQIMFVVSAEVTPQSVIKEAVSHIGEDKIIGLVLNKTKRKLGDKHGYGYGYGYSYGSDRVNRQ
ncbi:MAG: XrtA-associated tyrosine autokinase [Sedimenticola sp.]